MEKVVRRSSADEVADRLRAAIIGGDVALGASLSEGAIADELGTSRTPVREALRLLTLEGLVVLKPYFGAMVFTLSPEESRDLCEFRSIVELSALRMAFENDHAKLVQALSENVGQMKIAVEATDVRNYLILDSAFHETIVLAARNSHLYNAYLMIAAKAAALRNLIVTDPKRITKSIEGHYAIAEAIADRDLMKASEILMTHLSNAAIVFEKSLETSIEKAPRRRSAVSGALALKLPLRDARQ